MLELRGINKRFGSVRALRGAEFVLAAGEVHALLGENGAGKSTLMHIAYGMVAPDSGTTRVRGREVRLRSPRDARALGIGMVHQHFTSIEALTVAENIALAVGRAVGRSGGQAVGQLMRGLDPAARVESLSVALRQRLEIVKALATGARILLLDEPSAVLAPNEVEELLGLLRRFAEEDGAVALITHKLSEVESGADRVTVLRHGVVTLSGEVSGQSAASMTEAMVGGREVGKSGSREAGKSESGSKERNHVRPAGLVRIDDIAIHAGEIVGIAAVEGNGQRPLLRRIAGVGPPTALTAAVSVEGPVAFVPEDRTTEGLIPAMSLTENVVLGLNEDRRWVRGPWLDWKAARAHANWLIWSFGIGAPGPDVAAATLSGGNQQKVILARALESSPRILVAENPTRGLDVRATSAVHERLRGAAQAGVAVIVYSSDLDEVLELGQRVLVVREGRVSEAPRGADRRLVGEMMVGLRTG